MSAVDWLLVGQRAVNIIEYGTLASIFALCGLCGLGGVVRAWRDRETARRVRVSNHPATNVVRLHPRVRPFNWADHEEDGVA